MNHFFSISNIFKSATLHLSKLCSGTAVQDKDSGSYWFIKHPLICLMSA